MIGKRFFYSLWFCLALLPGLVSAQCTATWDIEELAGKKGSSMTLRFEGKDVATMPVLWVRSLAEVKRRVDQVSGIQTQMFLCGDSEPNAFAAIVDQRNVVAITLGMTVLLGEDWDAYAAVLGHESAHITLGHHRQTQMRETVIGLAQVFGSMALETFIRGSGGSAGLGDNLSSIGASLVSSAYSRGAEREADRQGISYTIRAGYDPQGAVRLHQKLNARGSFMSTHPGSAQRVAELQKIIAELQRQ